VIKLPKLPKIDCVKKSIDRKLGRNSRFILRTHFAGERGKLSD